jgi:hypothetical protein
MALAIAGFVALVAIEITVAPPVGWLLGVKGAVVSLLWVAVGVVRAVQLWQIRVVLRQLRRFDVETRAAILKTLDNDQAEAYLASRLEEHGAPSTVGLIERFGFSVVDIRELKFLTWITAVAAAGLLVAPFALVSQDALRFVSLACGIALAAAARTLYQHVQTLDRQFEVSPFGLSEIAGDGSVLRLYWDGQLSLRNRPWLRRIELAVESETARIEIPYSVVGFERLVQLIVTNGGFEVGEAAAERESPATVADESKG